MCKLVGWELRKMVCRWSFLAVLCVAMVFLIYIGNQRLDCAEGRDSEYQQLYVQYEGKSSSEFADIIKEQKALREQFPERYAESHTDSETGEQYEMQTILGIHQDNFIRFLDHDNNFEIEHGFLKDILKDRQKQGEMDNYGTRLLQKDLETYTGMPERTIVVSGDPNVTPFEGFFGSNYSLAALFLIVFAVAPLYSRERRTQMDTVLLTAKRGRRALWAKMIAVMLLSFFVGLLVQGIALALYSRHYSPAWSVSLASLERCNYSFAFISLSVGQAYLILLGLFLLGSLCAGLITMLFSSLSKSSVSALGASALVLLYPTLIKLMEQSLPSTDGELPYAIVQSAAYNMQQAVGWLKTLSIMGMQSAVNTGLWFRQYLNFFGWPVPELAVAAVFGAVVVLVTLFTPLWYIRRSKGRRMHMNRRKEAAA